MLKIILKAYGNIDRGENPHKEICKGKEIERDSIKELQKAFRAYIEKNGLMASNICLVDVVDMEKGMVIGKISYNGRFWDLNSKYCKGEKI